MRPLGQGKLIQVTATADRTLAPCGRQMASASRITRWRKAVSGSCPRQAASRNRWSRSGPSRRGHLMGRRWRSRPTRARSPSGQKSWPFLSRAACEQSRARVHHAAGIVGQRGRTMVDGVVFYTFDGIEGRRLVAPAAGGDPVRVAAHVTLNQAALTPTTARSAGAALVLRSMSASGASLSTRPVPRSPSRCSRVWPAPRDCRSRDGTIAYAIRRTESDLWSLPITARGKQPAIRCRSSATPVGTGIPHSRPMDDISRFSVGVPAAPPTSGS